MLSDVSCAAGLMDPHTVKTDFGLLEKWLQHCQRCVATLPHKKSNSKSGRQWESVSGHAMNNGFFDCQGSQAIIFIGTWSFGQVQECLMRGIPRRESFVDWLRTRNLPMNRMPPKNLCTHCRNEALEDGHVLAV